MVVLTVVLAPAAVALDADRDRNGPRQTMDRDAAAAAARHATGGRVLGVERRRGNGDEYRVRVLTPDGTVRTLEIDERSGRPRR
ncbi:MAG: peptidase M4 [Gammaproteobacteria bacterium]|nr:peptidase M4 [Gammaproteobacteria bacterium]